MKILVIFSRLVGCSARLVGGQRRKAERASAKHKGGLRRENIDTQNHMKEDYDDIINLPHHVSKNRPQMSMYQRAAQFAPFAALTGHDKAIEQTTKDNVESYENNS